jgi:hypothetical protein
VKGDALNQPGNLFRCGLAFRDCGIHAWDHFPMSRTRLLWLLPDDSQTGAVVRPLHANLPLSGIGSTSVCGTPIDSIMSFTDAGSSNLCSKGTRRRAGGRKSFSSA